tara:strand:- start:150 stop:392 length:243 start_codon:yes stop_codon:yes gene_type:complete
MEKINYHTHNGRIHADTRKILNTLPIETLESMIGEIKKELFRIHKEHGGQDSFVHKKTINLELDVLMLKSLIKRKAGENT